MMVGKTLAHSIRSFDLVGRWGGEEFVAVVVNVTGDELSRIAEKLRALVEQSQLAAGPHSVRVTISIGAAMAGDGDTAETLVAKVDRLMYQSKARGKNRVTIALGQETGKD
jgi:diguanylate cyclase (GGDEF)-like protein